jgi:hypothetical protein
MLANDLSRDLTSLKVDFTTFLKLLQAVVIDKIRFAPRPRASKLFLIESWTLTYL